MDNGMQKKKLRLYNVNAQRAYENGPFHLLKYRFDPTEKKETGNPTFDSRQTYKYQLYMEIPEDEKDPLTDVVTRGNILVRTKDIQWQYGNIQEPKANGMDYREISEYAGKGVLVCHPTKEHIIIEDFKAFTQKSIVIPADQFIAADGRYIKVETVPNYSQLVRLTLKEWPHDQEQRYRAGAVFACFSAVAETELIKVPMEPGNELKVDDSGPYFILWTEGVLTQRLNSATIFRGEGEVWLSPVARPVWR